MPELQQGNPMNPDVEKAVEYIAGAVGHYPDIRDKWAVVTQALRDQDTEIARLESAWHVETLNAKDQIIAAQEAENDRVKDRLSKAEALLRDIKRWDLNQVFDPKPDYLYALPYDLRARITAHFGGEQ